MRIVENVACTVCGCVCDDLRISIEENRISQAEGSCALSEAWFLDQGTVTPAVAERDGEPSSLEDAWTRAAEILSEANNPLIYGLSRSATEGQRAAIALADHLGAVVDTTASLCHAPSILAYQQVGESTCTLGEVRNRSDLVVFWGCDPLTSHPRHFERYSVEPAGRWIRGREDRTVVVADTRPTASAAEADIFLPVEPERDFEALWTLRALVNDEPIPPGCVTGAPLDALKDLADRMRRCRSGIVFFGLGLSRTKLGHLNVQALLTLVRDLHHHTRFYARRMRIVGDVTGADSVLAWQTGYPFSVSLGRGYPRFNPGEFSAEDILTRGEADAILLIGSEGVREFSAAARDALTQIPTIVLDHPTVPSACAPTVRFTTAVYGIHEPGTAYRMDEVPIRLRSFLECDYPTDHAVLWELGRRLGMSSRLPSPQ